MIIQAFGSGPQNNIDGPSSKGSSQSILATIGKIAIITIFAGYGAAFFMSATFGVVGALILIGLTINFLPLWLLQIGLLVTGNILRSRNKRLAIIFLSVSIIVNIAAPIIVLLTAFNN